MLDAGSGNGYFSWLAYQTGARVVAVNFDPSQVDKARDFLIGYRRADPRRLRFECRNLYELPSEDRTFDEIICFEVLEHIRGDREIVAQFFRVLRPGGILHLCCPYRLHPYYRAGGLDTEESGGHVRAGYTQDEYRALLEPAGFRIETMVGIGNRSVYELDRIARAIRNRFGDFCALPLLPIGLIALRFAKFNPAVPFSLYVKAVKRAASER